LTEIHQNSVTAANVLTLSGLLPTTLGYKTMKTASQAGRPLCRNWKNRPQYMVRILHQYQVTVRRGSLKNLHY